MQHLLPDKWDLILLILKYQKKKKKKKKKTRKKQIHTKLRILVLVSKPGVTEPKQ